MAYRIARSLDQLRNEIDAEWPERSTASDGWIGDAAHRERKSDHNPNAAGVVTALDVTAPEGHEVAERLRQARDRRVKYMISNGWICSSYPHKEGPAWSWRPYSGSNQHERHAHISVMASPTLYDDASTWFREEDMALTEAEQETVRQIHAALKGLDSDGSFAKYAVQHLRNHPSGGGGLSEDDVKRIAAQVVANSKVVP